MAVSDVPRARERLSSGAKGLELKLPVSRDKRRQAFAAGSACTVFISSPLRPALCKCSQESMKIHFPQEMVLGIHNFLNRLKSHFTSMAIRIFARVQCHADGVALECWRLSGERCTSRSRRIVPSHNCRRTSGSGWFPSLARHKPAGAAKSRCSPWRRCLTSSSWANLR